MNNPPRSDYRPAIVRAIRSLENAGTMYEHITVADLIRQDPMIMMLPGRLTDPLSTPDS